MPFGSENFSASHTLSGKTDEQIDIEKLIKRIEYLESLHKCACPSQKEQAEMISGRWHCPLHGSTIIHFQSSITKMIDKSGGHFAE